MQASDLKIFEAVARQGSMNRAALELHTVQSNVTARIRALEEEIGVALFHRHARGVYLTSAGHRLLPFVARFKKLVADAQSAARDNGQPKGPLLLGAMETTLALRLSPKLVAFARACPEVRLAVTTGATSRLVADVLEYRLDGAFVAGPVDHPDLYGETIFREELVLVTATTITTPRGLAAMDELKTIVFQIGCSYRQRLDALLAELGVVISNPLEFGSLDAVIACVSAGIGVTLLPKGVVGDAHRDGKVALHALSPEKAQADTLFVRRHDAYVSSAMRAFLDTVRADRD